MIAGLALLIASGALALRQLGKGSSAGAAFLSGAVQSELERAQAPPGVLAFYHDRDYRPLWLNSSGVPPFWRVAVLRPEAEFLAQQLAGAEVPGEAADRRAEVVSAALKRVDADRPATLARAEIALSIALAEHVRALRTPVEAARLAFLDPALQSPVDDRSILEAAASAPSLFEHLAAAPEINPVYRSLRRALAGYRAAWSGLPDVPLRSVPLRLGDVGEDVRRLRLRLGLAAAPETPARYDAPLAEMVRRFQAAHGLAPTGAADIATIAALNRGPGFYERLIEANLERARALPPITAQRYLLVNVASGELTSFEGGEARSSMRVVVGTREEPTPMMAGLLRYLVFNPYWNVPVDMVRDSIAPKVLSAGPAYFEAARFEALTDWTEEATPVNPRHVDWRAVASGAVELPVRQRPGGDNMMGQVKFMLPNELGIYLHDTPDKSAFARNDRLLSAGCVRLERADELVAWLLGPAAPEPAAAGQDERIHLETPVPVFITYLTVEPGPGGLRLHPDVYGSDPALLLQLARPRSRSSPGAGAEPNLGNSINR